MPYTSKRQWRAAMAGYIPGLEGEKAHEWAHETPSFKKLPDRAPEEKGKPTLRSKHSLYEALVEQKQELVEAFGKIAFAVPRAGQVMSSAKHVGSFPGMSTPNFLKSPGSTTASVTNPRLNIRNAMTKNMRA